MVSPSSSSSHPPWLARSHAMLLRAALLWLSAPLLLVDAQIRLHSPKVLAKKVFNRQTKAGYIQGSTATFGAPYYGQRLMGRIVYAPSKGDDYCKETDYDLPESTAAPEKNEDTERRQINIVMIKRGQSKCRFVTKVGFDEVWSSFVDESMPVDFFFYLFFCSGDTMDMKYNSKPVIRWT